MASRTLYPPIVRDYEPAFVVHQYSEGSQVNILTVNFDLTSLSGDGIVPAGDDFWIHAQIITTDGNQVINLKSEHDYEETTAGNFYYRSAGIILNLLPTQINNSRKYQIRISDKNFKTEKDFSNDPRHPILYKGWIPGQVYKLQLRISTVQCSMVDVNSQEAWLQKNSDYFSEWSTICYIKPIAPMVVMQNQGLSTDSFNYNDSSYENISGSIYSSLDEVEEYYYYYRIKLYKIVNGSANLLEDSGKIFSNEVSPTYYEYYYETELEYNSNYKVNVSYETKNGYIGNTDFYFRYNQQDQYDGPVQLITVEFGDINSSLEEEEEEGRIALKLYTASDTPSGSLYRRYVIRRSDSRSNFKKWFNIKYINFDTAPSASDINNYSIIYDYMIESGIIYQYAIFPIVNNDGDRGPGFKTPLNSISSLIIRNFNYSYLIGEGGQQLKLEFDNAIGSYSVRMVEAKQETIGSKYPYIANSSNVAYQTFPIAGLISFNMDEQNTFLKQGLHDIYGDYSGFYSVYNIKNGISQYDYTREREFRKNVLALLQDKKPKLFKSPTEGNIIIRITDVSCTPNQSLSRMIYSFSGTASEIDDNTMDNYIKYGFYYPGDYINI